MRFLILIGLLASANAQYSTPSCDGKQVIVNLFEWKWTDVALECENFLGKMGFCAVQVSPPNEHSVIAGENYPWWERFQPVSYILTSRSGNRAEFIDMVNRCNAVGVRIIVDAVINHMTGIGTKGPGSAGSNFSSDDRNALSYPAVPYSSNYTDFSPRALCNSVTGDVDNYMDATNVRNCFYVGLADLYQANDYVRVKISTYLNDLISIGVMGFRFDAAEYMWPEDLLAIQDMTNDLNSSAGFPATTRPFFFHDVLDNGQQGVIITVDEYYANGLVTEFRYCKTIENGINDFSQLPIVYNPDLFMTDYAHAFVFVDNYDNERSGWALTFKDGINYTSAAVYTLAQDYGFARIMSSYDFSDQGQGPPSVGDVTNDVIFNPDGTCGGGWICEHRWPSIAKMVQFRNVVNAGTSIANWYQVGNTVAFSRGNKGFFAMNKDGSFTGTLQTGLPAGDYCDLISDCAKVITVNADGTAVIVIDNTADPFIAICVGCSAIAL